MRPCTKLLLAIVIVETAGAQRVQFDAASVRQVPPEGAVLPTGIHGGPGTADPGRMTYGSQSMRDLLVGAYGLRANQVIGPDWMRRSMYDIAAKLPAGAAKGQVPLMLQALLAERFGLALHHETRDLPYYELTAAAKSVQKLKPAAPVTDPASASNPGAPPAAANRDGTVQWAPGARGFVITGIGSRGLRMTARSQSLADLATRLSKGMLDGIVVDKSGIDMKFDFSFDYSQGQNLSTDAKVDSDTYPPLRIAIQDQLGLKLEKKTGPFEVIVIDRVNQIPAAN